MTRARGESSILHVAVFPASAGCPPELTLALPPGLGLNAFFGFIGVVEMGILWETALAAVFAEGVLFIQVAIGEYGDVRPGQYLIAALLAGYHTLQTRGLIL